MADHLLVCADLGDSADYADAVKKATAYTADGHKDFGAADTLAESALCYATCKEHFQRDWYWTGVQPADDPGYAWIQSFDDGNQVWGHEGDRYRVFAVRRIPIQ